MAKEKGRKVYSEVPGRHHRTIGHGLLGVPLAKQRNEYHMAVARMHLIALNDPMNE